MRRPGLSWWSRKHGKALDAPHLPPPARQVGNGRTSGHDGAVDIPAASDELARAVRGLRREVDGVILPLDVTDAAEAREHRKDMLDQLDDYILPRLADADAPLLAVVGGSTGAGSRLWSTASPAML